MISTNTRLNMSIVNASSLGEHTEQLKDTLKAINQLEGMKAMAVNSKIRESLGKASDNLSEYVKELDEWIAAELLQSYRRHIFDTKVKM